MRPFEALIDDWQDWPVLAQPALLKKFTDGLNHETALLKVGRDQLVLKRFLSDSERQIESQLWAASQGIAPEVIFAPPNHEYMLMTALVDGHLREGQLNNVSLQAIAEGLSVMHKAKPGPRSSEGFDIRDFCRSYLNQADNRALQQHEKLKPILDYFYNDPTPWVFCHNDLVTANCFIDGQVAQFIDWEYADLHNPWFDLAAIIYYFKLADEEAQTFLTSYNHEWVTKLNDPIYYASQITVLWADMLWHLAKFGIGYWQELEVKQISLDSLIVKIQSEVD